MSGNLVDQRFSSNSRQVPGALAIAEAKTQVWEGFGLKEVLANHSGKGEIGKSGGTLACIRGRRH